MIASVGERGERWAVWQLRDRVANEELHRSRDRVLERAQIKVGDRVLDVGCGTGLLALAALESVGATGQVIGVDISQAALDACRAAAPNEQAARLITCWGSATALPVANESCDVLVERSVLIYVDDKQRAFHEYRRVLRSGGRLSLFEPVNRHAVEEYDFDLGPVRELHDRLAARRRDVRQRTNAAMLDFDADDLVVGLQLAGFEVAADHEVDKWELRDGAAWLDQMRRAPNPLASSRTKLAHEVLGADAERYLAFMADGVSRGGYRFRCPSVFITGIATQPARLPGRY